MDWSKPIGRYIVVMLLQVLLFNRLQLAGVCHPYVYILCLLMMPAAKSPGIDMVIGALAGLVMDIFCNTIGVHMAACVLIMFIRPAVLSTIVSDKERLNEEINSHTLGIGAMLRYTVLMVVVYHLSVFLIASWSWSHIGFVLIETAVSSMITIILILSYNILKYK